MTYSILSVDLNDNVSSKQQTKDEVEAAAKVAGIQHYDASVAVSGKPVIWNK